jgi:aspartate racemase
MSKTDRIAGVMGGLGPEATVDFMARVLALTPAVKDQDHIHLLVDQNPKVPNRQDAILRGSRNPAPALAAMARRLEAAGAEFIVMPCNAAHAFQGDIEAAIDIPFVSIVDVTVEAVSEEGSKVGLMATPAGIAAGTYQAAFGDGELLVFDDNEREDFMALVYAIKAGDDGRRIVLGMRKLAEALVARGAEVLIAGCTEIPLVLSADDVDVPLVSSTDELARRTIELARGERPLPDN